MTDIVAMFADTRILSDERSSLSVAIPLTRNVWRNKSNGIVQLVARLSETYADKQSDSTKKGSRLRPGGRAGNLPAVPPSWRLGVVAEPSHSVFG